MFLLLALPNGTPEQLQKLQTKTVHAQILWIGENIVEKYISANPVCGTNIQPPSVKNVIVVSMPIKFM